MNTAVSVDQVSMKFHINANRTTSLKEWVIAGLKGKLKYNDFYALDKVSFDVEYGSVVGIVGENGSGKSTLLKIIAGVYKPTEGRCIVDGRIAPMLELGSGFDMELSGRDNIYLNGAILGYDKNFLKKKYDEIVEFSELNDFIYQPIKTYSSGMLMRLAFSVATLVNPEILIVDEILAVGDEHFQQKSGERMKQMMSGGTTVLLVSHNMAQIRELCGKVIWLSHGRVMRIGEVDDVCTAYQQSLITR